MQPVRDPEGREIEYLQRTGAVCGRNVIEIGCGDGRLAWRYANLADSVAGVDPDFARLDESGSARPETVIKPVLLAQAVAETLPFPAGAFETAVFAWSL